MVGTLTKGWRCSRRRGTREEGSGGLESKSKKTRRKEKMIRWRSEWGGRVGGKGKDLANFSQFLRESWNIALHPASHGDGVSLQCTVAILSSSSLLSVIMVKFRITLVQLRHDYFFFIFLSIFSLWLILRRETQSRFTHDKSLLKSSPNRTEEATQPENHWYLSCIDLWPVWASMFFMLC